MVKRSALTLLAAAALLVLLLWSGTVSGAGSELVAGASDGGTARPRAVGVLAAVFLALAAFRRSEG